MKNPGPYGTRLTSIIRLIPPLIDAPILSFSSTGTTDLPPAQQGGFPSAERRDFGTARPA